MCLSLTYICMICFENSLIFLKKFDKKISSKAFPKLIFFSLLLVHQKYFFQLFFSSLLHVLAFTLCMLGLFQILLNFLPSSSFSFIYWYFYIILQRDTGKEQQPELLSLSFFLGLKEFNQSCDNVECSEILPHFQDTTRNELKGREKKIEQMISLFSCYQTLFRIIYLLELYLYSCAFFFFFHPTNI